MTKDPSFIRKMIFKNTLLAMEGGLLVTGILLYCQISGGILVSAPFLFSSMAFYWIVSFILLAVISTNVSSKLKDPALTRPQMYWSVTASIYFMCLMSRMHELMYLLFLQIVVFGTFRLKPKDYQVFSFYVLVIFTVAQYSFYYRGVFKEISDLVFNWLTIAFCLSIMTSICKSNTLLKLRLREKNEALTEASEAKSQFLANMSHELRTPLNGVIGMASLLDDTSLDDEQKSMVKVISSSSNNLLEVINNILDYSKIDAKKMVLEERAIDLKSVLDDVYFITKVKADNKDIEYQYEFDSDINIHLIADELRLKQILLNLISNAIKFTDEGFVKLSAELINQTDDEIFIKFSVKDTGIGISESLQKSIFDQFSQEDSSTTRKYGGTGLGLSIASEIVKLMGSDINLISQKDVGSEFSFLICFKSADTTPYPLENIVTENHETLENKGEKSILVVDDDRTNQIVTRKIIEFLGHQVTLASDGEEALKKCFNEKFDLVLMDCQMPVMDGYSATRKIRLAKNLNQKTKIFALTANALAGDESKCIEAGMDGYVAKPIKKDDIEKVINSENTDAEVYA